MGIFSKPKFIGYSIETAFNEEENERYWCVFSLFQKGKKQPEKKLASYQTDKGTNRMQFDTKQEAIDKLYSFDKNPKIVFIENIDKIADLRRLDVNQDILKSIVVNGTREFWFYNLRTFFGSFNKKMIFKGAYANQISFKQNFPDGTNKPGLLPEQLLLVLLDNQKRVFEFSQDVEGMKKFNDGINQCVNALRYWTPSEKKIEGEVKQETKQVFNQENPKVNGKTSKRSKEETETENEIRQNSRQKPQSNPQGNQKKN